MGGAVTLRPQWKGCQDFEARVRRFETSSLCTSVFSVSLWLLEWRDTTTTESYRSGFYPVRCGSAVWVDAHSGTDFTLDLTFKLCQIWNTFRDGQ